MTFLPVFFVLGAMRSRKVYYRGTASGRLAAPSPRHHCHLPFGKNGFGQNGGGLAVNLIPGRSRLHFALASLQRAAQGRPLISKN